MEHMRLKRKPGTPHTSSPTAITVGIEANIDPPQAGSSRISSSDAEGI